MKTEDELKEITMALEELNKKLAALGEEELSQVTGGRTDVAMRDSIEQNVDVPIPLT